MAITDQPDLWTSDETVPWWDGVSEARDESGGRAKRGYGRVEETGLEISLPTKRDKTRWSKVHPEDAYKTVVDRLRATRPVPRIIRWLIPLLNPRLMGVVALVVSVGALFAIMLGAPPSLAPIAVIVAALAILLRLALRSSFNAAARRWDWGRPGPET